MTTIWRAARVRGGWVSAGLVAALTAGSARGQNLVQDCTFEAWGLWGAPWKVKAGSPTLYTNLSMAPNCPNVIGLRYAGGILEEIGQTSYNYYPNTDMYVAYAEVAGDRSVAGGWWQSTLRARATSTMGTATGYLHADVPLLGALFNTNIQYSTWKPLVRRMPMSIPQGTNFTFDLRDDDDRGVLVDQVHLFPIRWEECTCPGVMTLAGYSVNFDYTSADQWPQPDRALRRGTAAASCCTNDPCGGQADNDGVWIWSKPCSKSQEMLVAAWTYTDQTGVGPNTPTALSLTLEAQAIQGTVGFTVQFYDWKLQRWAGPQAIGIGACSYNNMGSAYPGGLLTAQPECFTVNWAPYTIPNASGCATPLGHYVSNPAGSADGTFFLPGNSPANLVLARIVFLPRSPEWFTSIGTGNPPPPNDWVAKVHYVGIDCH